MIPGSFPVATRWRRYVIACSLFSSRGDFPRARDQLIRRPLFLTRSFLSKESYQMTNHGIDILGKSRLESTADPVEARLDATLAVLPFPGTLPGT